MIDIVSRHPRVRANGGDGRSPGTFRVEFDTGEESVTEVVVDTVAVIEDVDPTDLDPLASAVDTDALDTLFESASNVRRVVFDYDGFEITVEDAGYTWFQRL